MATAGQLVITEFRLSGPGGAADEYAEFTNVGGVPVSLAGFTLRAATGADTTLPADAGVLAPGRAYLVTGPEYSLGEGVTQPDFGSEAELGSGGLQLVAPDPLGTVLDAVGADFPGYHTGTALPAFDGDPTDQYAWVRTEQNGVLRTTQDNRADFALVSTTGGAVGGLPSTVGSPSPSGRNSPVDMSHSVTTGLLDSNAAISAEPNRVISRTGPGVGQLEIRRVISNQTAQTMTALQLRLVDISAANGLAPLNVSPALPRANLRLVDPAQATVAVGVDDGPPVIVQNGGPAAPSTAVPGGGLNSVILVPLPEGGLAPGAAVAVGLTFAVDTGGRFWASFVEEATLASGEAT